MMAMMMGDMMNMGMDDDFDDMMGFPGMPMPGMGKGKNKK